MPLYRSPFQLFLTWIDNLNCIVHTAILTLGFLPSCVRIITLLNEVSHLSKRNELVTNYLVILVKSDTCNISFSHLKVTNTLLLCCIHSTNLRTKSLTKIFKTGGAQAVAALAYGTQSIPAVDKIVGPGNIYVATAKRKVFGKVGIDMIAGPSEILVLADGSCNPAWVAADLLSQAEHDKLASPVLVTDSADLAKAVQAELEVQIPQLPRAAIARASVDDNGKIIVCTDLHKAIEACNIIAPEHLEVCVEDPFGVLNEIKNAGSIFLGRNVPEALGDYFAGPNHTLPTSGTARFSSPLGVDDFVKKSSFLYYTREALGEVAPRIADFAEREGLHAHAKSVTIRYEK